MKEKMTYTISAALVAIAAIAGTVLMIVIVAGWILAAFS